MKQVLTVILALALLIEAALFFGLGFGLGALSTTASPATTCIESNNFCWTQNNFYLQGGNIEIQVVSSIAGVTGNGTGTDPITSMLTGGESTSITFAIVASQNPNSCTRNEVWQGGYEAYYAINWPQPVTGMIDGTQYTGSTWAGGAQGTTGTLNNNESIGANGGDIVGCINTGNYGYPYGNKYLPGPVGPLYQHTMTLVGNYPAMKATINFYTDSDWCSKNGGNVVRQCYGLANQLWNVGLGLGCGICGNDGGWGGAIASASFEWQTASASFKFINSQNNYNGGTLTATFWTGYDGPNGYQFSINAPSERTGGGQVDKNFANNPMSIPNFCIAGCTYSWSIPTGLDTNLSGHDLAWDQWSGVLEATIFTEQITQFTIINPAYAPTTPVITYTSSGAGLYPAIGDTVTLTIFSNASATSGKVRNISVEVYYLTGSSSSSQAPACGGGWVTPCPNGQIVTVSNSGNNAVGTYKFPVNPPINTMGIGVAAVSGSSISPSLFGYLYITIKSADCSIGSTCDPYHSTITLWAEVGPILLALMLMTGIVLLMLWVPAGMWYVRFGVPAVVLVLIVILWAFGLWTSPFVAGGFLNANGGTQ